MSVSKPLPVAAQCALAGACGLAFGVAFDKSRVFQPDAIVDQVRATRQRATQRAEHVPRGADDADGARRACCCCCAQMLMQRFIMLKMFMAAVGTSAASLGVISVVAPEKFAAARVKARRCTPAALRCRFTASNTPLARAARCAQVSGGKKNLKVAALGAGLLGLGMAMGGACPGMVLAQVGSGVATSGYTLAGCLSGALVHALVEPALTQRFAAYANNAKEATFVDKRLFPGVPYARIALPLAAMCGLAVAGLEYAFPWRSEARAVLPRALADAPMGLEAGLAATAWPPQVGGAIIGALQLPLVIGLGHLLGSSSSYVTVVGCCVPDAPGRADLAAKRGPANWWQVAFVVRAKTHRRMLYCLTPDTLARRWAAWPAPRFRRPSRTREAQPRGCTPAWPTPAAFRSCWAAASRAAAPAATASACVCARGLRCMPPHADASLVMRCTQGFSVLSAASIVVRNARSHLSAPYCL